MWVLNGMTAAWPHGTLYLVLYVKLIHQFPISVKKSAVKVEKDDEMQCLKWSRKIHTAIYISTLVFISLHVL